MTLLWIGLGTLAYAGFALLVGRFCALSRAYDTPPLSEEAASALDAAWAGWECEETRKVAVGGGEPLEIASQAWSWPEDRLASSPRLTVEDVQQQP